MQTIAKQQHNTEAQNARLFALVNIAMADAGLAAWNTKYDDAMWRPMMGIRNMATTMAIPRPTVMPIGRRWARRPAIPRPGETNFTPPFPAYTSGHATFGAAAFQILTRFYGRDDIKFTFVSDEFNGITKDADGQRSSARFAAAFHSFTKRNWKTPKAEFISAFTGPSIATKESSKEIKSPTTCSITCSSPAQVGCRPRPATTMT